MDPGATTSEGYEPKKLFKAIDSDSDDMMNIFNELEEYKQPTDIFKPPTLDITTPTSSSTPTATSGGRSRKEKVVSCTLCGTEHAQAYTLNGVAICDECWPEAMASVTALPHEDMLAILEQRKWCGTYS